MSLPHGFEAAVPVQELEDGHQFLKLKHGSALVGLEHEPEGADAGVRVVRFLRVTFERRAGFCDGLLDKVVRYPPRRMLVEDAVHERNLGCTSPGLRLRGAVLTTKANRLQPHVRIVRLYSLSY